MVTMERILLGALLCRSAGALFEDQAGKIDWGRQNIGRVTSAVFHSSGSQRLSIVATEAGAVAGIDIRTGEASWRRLLPEGDSVSELISSNTGVVSVGLAWREGGRVGSVRMWSPLGGLLWDAVSDEAGERPPAVAVGDKAMYFGSGATVIALHAATGKELWRWRAPSDKGASTVTVQLAG